MSHPLAAAIDVGGTKIAVGLVDAQGSILAQGETPTAPEHGYAGAIQRTIALLRELLAESGASIEGIGIGSTGPIDAATGIYGEVGTLPGWLGSPIGPDLQAAFGVPVCVENDANAATLAEAMWGAGRGSRNLLYVTISTGIGVGILVDGRLYHGAKGAHPEIGHMILDASGPLCYCGATGCWEILSSGPGLEKWMREHAGGELSAKEICARARQGDPLALEGVRGAAHYIGIGLANLVTCFCPDTIVLGGGMMQSADLLLPPALEIVKRLCTQVPVENTSIVLAGLGRRAGLLGAACVWFGRAGLGGVHAGARESAS